MTKVWILISGVALLSSVAPAAQSGGRPETIFQCSFGKKQVAVRAVGPMYVYSFGLPGHPEVEVVGDPKRKNVYASDSVGTLDMIRQVRLQNGRFSYVVFYGGLTKAYATPSATAGSGLAVFDGSRRIAKFSCKSGRGFQAGWDPSNLPEEDYSDYDASS